MTTHTLHNAPVNDQNLGDLRDENKARWIRVSVDMLEHDAFAGEPFSRRDAWLWLIANAAWKPRRFKVANVNGMIELQRGQTLAARGYLANKWMWGEKKVRLFLEFLQSENMIEMVQSKGRFANIVTICNYEKYQTATESKGQLKDQLEASSGPVEGQTLTKNTNTTNKKTNTPAREERRSGMDYWANAISAPPSPETHSHVGVTMQDGEITLHNGARAMWLEQFGGDAKRLQLALKQAAGFVQPNSGRPLEAQVGAQLARIVGQKIDSDKRYEKAKASSAKPYQSDFRSQLEAI
jgi:hypothetical protein